MTRKEIEKRCLEEMQQTIPDTEALWQRIETQLPQQEVKEEMQYTAIKMHRFRPFMTIAACLAIVITIGSVGSRILTGMMDKATNNLSSLVASSYKQDTQIKQEAQDHIPHMENAAEEKREEALRSYDSLRFSDSDWTNSVIDYDMLLKKDQNFDEAEVLANTENILVVTLVNGEQDLNTGEMVYELSVECAYGNDTVENQTLQLRSKSAYLLQTGRSYILPMYREENEWKLSFENAPQIEMTLDNEVVFHDGWKSLCTYENDELEYFEYDEFRHKMRIANVKVLNQLLAAWEDAQNR